MIILGIVGRCAGCVATYLVGLSVGKVSGIIAADSGIDLPSHILSDCGIYGAGATAGLIWFAYRHVKLINALETTQSNLMKIIQSQNATQANVRALDVGMARMRQSASTGEGGVCDG